MNIGRYLFEEYIEVVKSFHGFVAPGVVVGGIMVDLAIENMPEGVLFNALCETPKCLPDAVQLLTPCTTGNGWLTVSGLGLFALSLYDKNEGSGVRVFLDQKKLKLYPEINNWLYKLKPKSEQNRDLLLAQIQEAGRDICGIQHIHIMPDYLKKHSTGAISTCTLCGEAYPRMDGDLCKNCQGESRYTLKEKI